jgi:4-amino-4-deoxy-L-arabinose transferase-like glycosyltransferase
LGHTALALAVLTKELVAVALLLLIFGACGLLGRDWSRLRAMR